MTTKLILASGSPRRSQMLNDLNVQFDVYVPNVEEVRKKGESPDAYVRRLSKSKAMAASEKLGLELNENQWCVLAADTIVVLGQAVLEKPKDKADALRMLSKLSGKEHRVLTGFCLFGRKGKRKVCVQKVIHTKIRFLKRDRNFWERYIKTGEPMDKAGSYAAQGGGMSFIQSVSGSYSNVVGLPLSEVLVEFKRAFGVELTELHDVRR